MDNSDKYHCSFVKVAPGIEIKYNKNGEAARARIELLKHPDILKYLIKIAAVEEFDFDKIFKN